MVSPYTVNVKPLYVIVICVPVLNRYYNTHTETFSFILLLNTALLLIVVFPFHSFGEKKDNSKEEYSEMLSQNISHFSNHYMWYLFKSGGNAITFFLEKNNDRKKGMGEGGEGLRLKSPPSCYL